MRAASCDSLLELVVNLIFFFSLVVNLFVSFFGRKPIFVWRLPLDLSIIFLYLLLRI